jgi:hypothetical protein
MGGTQIRWRRAARIAGIALAAIAAIAALPALIGSDAPPPVPDDVGLIPTQVSPPPPEAAAPQPPPRAPRVKEVTELPPRAPRVKDKSKKIEAKKKRRAKRRRERRHIDQGGTEETPPAPVMTYAPAPTPPEFGIEP